MRCDALLLFRLIVLFHSSSVDYLPVVLVRTASRPAFICSSALCFLSFHTVTVLLLFSYFLLILLTLALLQDSGFSFIVGNNVNVKSSLYVGITACTLAQLIWYKSTHAAIGALGKFWLYNFWYMSCYMFFTATIAYESLVKIYELIHIDRRALVVPNHQHVNANAANNQNNDEVQNNANNSNPQMDSIRDDSVLLSGINIVEEMKEPSADTVQHCALSINQSKDQNNMISASADMENDSIANTLCEQKSHNIADNQMVLSIRISQTQNS